MEKKLRSFQLLRALWKYNYLAYFVFYGLLLIGIVLYISARQNSVIVDENAHFNQILRFISGIREKNPTVAQLPFYHLLIAGILSLLHTKSLSVARLISAGLSYFAIPAFFFTARDINPKTAFLKTIQFSFLPLMFGYIPLVYTEGFALSLVLMTLFLTVRKRYIMAGMVGLLSVLVRQNDIIWIFFITMYMFVRNDGFSIQRRKILRWFSDAITFVPSYLVIAVFLIANRGWSQGTRDTNIPGLYFGNLYIAIVYVFFLLIPVMLSHVSRVMIFIKKYWIFVVVLSAIGYLFFLNTWVVVSGFNWSQWFLHNVVIVFFISTITQKSIFFLFFVISTLFLIVTTFERDILPILSLSTIVALVTPWTIEPRYAIIPMVLFLLFRKQTGVVIELIQTTLFVLMSLYLMYGISQLWFFP